MVSINNVLLFFGMLFWAATAIFESQLLIISLYSVIVLHIAACVCFALGLVRSGKLYFNKHVPTYLILWLCLFPLFLLGSLKNERLVLVRMIACYISVALLMNNDRWFPLLNRVILAFAGLSVLATLFFFIYPDAYSGIVDFYGYFPSGTGRLEYGYRAGISAHYSHNGIFISIFLMLTICIYLALQSTKKAKMKPWVILAIFLGLFAFVLNSKRGVMIWSLLSVCITGFINSKHKSMTFWKVILLVATLIGTLQFLSESVPQVEYLLNRFATMGIDTSSEERIDMWKLAIRSFLSSPIFGIGFLNYRGLYDHHLAYNYKSTHLRLDAHNVYLQMLCETGIVGFSLYMLAVVWALHSTVKLVLNHRNSCAEKKIPILFSLCLQIFYLFYSLSGNCLYDMMIYFYAFALAITASYSVSAKRKDK